MPKELSGPYDVVVVGGGNAGLCAALSAREHGARVLLLERAPEQWRGGNSAFTAGSMRVAFNGLDDLRELMPDLSNDEIDRTDFGKYTREAFLEDMARVTDYRTDPELAEVLVGRSYETLRWLRKHGVRFVPQFGRQAYEVGGKFKFHGGTVVEVVGGGEGLIDFLMKAAASAGVDILYDSRAVGLVRTKDG